MGAGVMLRSLLALRNADAGFDPDERPDDAASTLPATRYRHAGPAAWPSSTRRAGAHARAAGRRGGGHDRRPAARGRLGAADRPRRPGRAACRRDQPTVQVRQITPGYLRAMRIPLLRGRDVADTDVDVMLVSRGAAKLLWGDADPIGRRVTLPLLSRTQLRRSRRHRRRREAGRPRRCRRSRRSTTTRTSVTRPLRHAGAAHVGAAGDAGRAGRRRHPRARPGAAGRGRSHDGGGARRHADVAALQRAAPRLLRCWSRWRSPRSASTASCPTSCAAAAARSASAPRSARGPATCSGWCSPKAWRLRSSASPSAPWRRSLSARILERLVFGVSASDPLTLAAVAATLAFVALARQPGPRLARRHARSADGAARRLAQRQERGRRSGVECAGMSYSIDERNAERG